MYFDELHPRRKDNPVAQEYWNSAATGDPLLGADVFDLVVSLLPSRSSSRSALKITLQAIGRRLRRNLRQDDWGPTRGDQTEALRQIGGTIDTLRSAFDVLSPEEVNNFCVQFKQAFLQQPPKSWADFMSLLEESADFYARARGAHIGFRSIATQAGYFVDYPARVDDNTQSAIFEACAGPNIEGPACRRYTYVMEDVRDWLKQFAALHEKALTSLIAKRGPEKFYSLAFAVSTLALQYDGVPWNNNNAEHAIKSFARLRDIIAGSSTKKGIEEYLTLLSVAESCKYRGVDFLDFLRSGETDIATFARPSSAKWRC